jgi:hypothetical protein
LGHGGPKALPRAWFKKGSGTFAGTARRVLRTKVPDPFLNLQLCEEAVHGDKDPLQLARPGRVRRGLVGIPGNPRLGAVFAVSDSRRGRSPLQARLAFPGCGIQCACRPGAGGIPRRVAADTTGPGKSAHDSASLADRSAPEGAGNGWPAHSAARNWPCGHAPHPRRGQATGARQKQAAQSRRPQHGKQGLRDQGRAC